MRFFIAAALLVFSCLSGARAENLQIYFIDVEGGQATLIVSPSGETMLVDAGWPGFGGRDADRIAAALKSAGAKRIDYLLATHYHLDHVGGVPQLVERIPVVCFVDHGPSVESGQEADELFAAYGRVRAGGKHLVVKPGDKIPIKGLDVEVLASAGERIRDPLPGAGTPNPLCARAQRLEEDQSENPQSIGTLLRYGKFRLLNLADLTWNKELALACPRNLIGSVDVYLTTHHGNADSGPAAMVHALRPRVAIMNNGARKGGSPQAWRIMRSSPGLEDIWQLHYSVGAGDDANAAEPFIANPEEPCQGYGIKLTARRDGTFVLANLRNGIAKTYGTPTGH